MPGTTAEKLRKALSSGKLGGVFFLYGEEEYLKEDATASLIRAHLDPSTRDFNYDQLYGDRLEPETLASICGTPPMMAEWRVVVVRDAQALAASARSRAPIEALLERPVPGLALILVATLPDRSKAAFYEKLKKETTSVEFPLLDAGDLPAWLGTRAEDLGVKIDIAAARALAAAIGSDLGVLSQELAKLVEYVGVRRKIERTDVEAVVGIVPQQNRWEWFDLVGGGRIAEARRAIPTLLDAGESGVGLVIGLGTHMLRVAIAAAGGERALSEALPGHQKFLASRIARQARAWTETGTRAALDDLLRADRLLKSTSLGEQAILEELLLRLEQHTTRQAA
ncbi:MAG: DNA polymerase III subunit delta [Longimicrobiales bacterium]